MVTIASRSLLPPLTLYTKWIHFRITGPKSNGLPHNIAIGTVVVPSLGDPRRERPPDVYGHAINVLTHLNVKLPPNGGHLPNADSHLLVVRTCYNGQFKQIPRFRWSFQPTIARGEHPKLRPTVFSNSHATIW